MPLVVENGTIVANSNGYISVADCDAYHSERQNAAWTGLTAVKEAAIINAAEYLDYAYNWKGVRVSDLQTMAWPRSLWSRDETLANEINEYTVPAEVVKACAYLALKALTGELMPAQTGGRLTSESVSVGGAVTRSRSYAGGGADATERRFPFVDRLVARWATGGSSGVRGHHIERA